MHVVTSYTHTLQGILLSTYFDEMQINGYGSHPFSYLLPISRWASFAGELSGSAKLPVSVTDIVISNTERVALLLTCGDHSVLLNAIKWRLATSSTLLQQRRHWAICSGH